MLIATLAAGAAATCAATAMREPDGARPERTSVDAAKAARDEAVRVADTDAWLEGLRSGSYWKEKRRAPEPVARPLRQPAKRPSQTIHVSRGAGQRAVQDAGQRAAQNARQRPAQTAGQSASHWYTSPRQSAATYRTVCVRLCDGFYWPVSFATTRRKLRHDAEICRNACAAPVALYYHPNPGGEPEDMVSLEGQPYTALARAFLYRTAYEPSCKCRPHPWEPDAIARHQSYAGAADEPEARAQE